ncbi:MAG TPA: histidine kinase N-terminal 7TM domain-containing protein, partial [Candidatus Saccharimonadales bacterium]|nr:histidine kinase N-terminal 7TM domain-containing protein [Candidatus Saccharimonadales bacterium]
MTIDPIVVQGAISVPLAFALALYALARQDRSRLHLFSAGVILSLGLWIVALMLRRISSSPVVGQISLHLEHVTTTVMAPLFLVMMGHFARHPSFERSHAATLAFSAIFALFFLAFATNDWHHLMVVDPAAALADEHPAKWAGPLYWGLQFWIFVADLLGLALCLWASRRGRTPDERRRPLLVVGALVLPILAHVVYLGGWLPIHYTLAPGSVSISLLLFMRGIHRHGLFESQPIVRQDLIEHLPDGLVL